MINEPARRTTVEVNTTGLPADCDAWWLEVRSERNRTISRTSDVAAAAPAAATPARTGPVHWFPVIDVELSGEWTARATVTGHAVGDTIVVNGYLGAGAYSTGHGSELVVPRAALQHWENSFFVPTEEIVISEFRIRRRTPVGVPASFQALGGEWRGETRVVGVRGGEEIELCGWTSTTVEGRVRSGEGAPLTGRELPDVKTEELERRLGDLVGWIVRSVNHTPDHPTKDGFYLFYDLDSRSYRTPQWMWTWGPSIRLLLECAADRRAGAVASPDELNAIALGAAEVTLRCVERAPFHPARGLMKVRWNVRFDSPSGYLGYHSAADTGFCAGWAWPAAYRTSGDPRFVDAARGVVGAIDRLVDEFGVPPMDYIEDTLSWKDFTLDEAGFAPEAHAALYDLTGDEDVLHAGVRLMDTLIAKFESPSGLWHRQYNYRKDVLDRVAKECRGQGWAMEGLLAMDRMVPGGSYRERAIRMAHVMIADQREDGSWLTITDGTLEQHGVSEKGTALWSLLLYQLYRQTGQEEFLAPARRALWWCLANQYYGEDPNGRGGIPGVTPNSGVVYREWFPLICGYTCAFAGLAIREELAIRSLGVNA